MFVRWDHLRAGEDEARRLPGYADAVVRTFDAPEAMDVRFYEVRAKSGLNRVPEMSKVPFRWTINPYRGCTHACVYCISGETPILMADGRTKAIADLQVGDRVYGTTRDGAHRRYTPTEVLAHWSTVKPAYRIALEDGTELVASGDHRFLSDRGWKHVTGAERGPDRRPHLTPSTKLIGTGRFEDPPGSSAVPLITRKRTLDGVTLKSKAKLEVLSIEPLGVDLPMYDITTGTGDFVANGVVSHNCFARPTHKFLDLNPGRDFEREIVVKVNVPELVRAELGRRSWKGEHVALGTNTDPYQWVESRYRLMPGIWEAMRDFSNPCSVLTKSPLALRDLPLMKEIAARAPFSANFSVPTLDERAWRASEPHTPHPRARLEAVAEVRKAGIPSTVLIAPLMPGINDSPEQIEPILELAAEAGATSVGGIALHLRGEVRGIFFDWLRSHRPDLIARYEELYRRGAYAPPAERRRLSQLVRTRQEEDADTDHRGPTRAAAREPPGRAAQPPDRQPSLF